MAVSDQSIISCLTSELLLFLLSSMFVKSISFYVFFIPFEISNWPLYIRMERLSVPSCGTTWYYKTGQIDTSLILQQQNKLLNDKCSFAGRDYVHERVAIHCACPHWPGGDCITFKCPAVLLSFCFYNVFRLQWHYFLCPLAPISGSVFTCTPAIWLLGVCECVNCAKDMKSCDFMKYSTRLYDRNCAF